MFVPVTDPPSVAAQRPRTYLEALLRNVEEWARAEQSPGGVEHDQPPT